MLFVIIARISDRSSLVRPNTGDCRTGIRQEVSRATPRLIYLRNTPFFLLKICGIVHLNLCYCSDLESCPSDLSSKSVPSKNGNRPSFLKRKKREKKKTERKTRDVLMAGRPPVACDRNFRWGKAGYLCRGERVCLYAYKGPCEEARLNKTKIIK